MIEASGTYSNRADGLVRFPDTVTINSIPRYDFTLAMHFVEVQFLSPDNELLSRLPMEFSAATVGSESGTGTEAEDEYYNKIERLVAGTLQLMTYNTSNSITFSIV